MLSKELLDDLSKNKQHHVIEIVKEMQCEDIETISKQIRCIDINAKIRMYKMTNIFMYNTR